MSRRKLRGTRGALWRRGIDGRGRREQEGFPVDRGKRVLCGESGRITESGESKGVSGEDLIIVVKFVGRVQGLRIQERESGESWVRAREGRLWESR